MVVQVDREAQFGMNTETRRSLMTATPAERSVGDSVHSAQPASTGLPAMKWHVRLMQAPHTHLWPQTPLSTSRCFPINCFQAHTDARHCHHLEGHPSIEGDVI